MTNCKRKKPIIPPIINVEEKRQTNETLAAPFKLVISVVIVNHICRVKCRLFFFLFQKKKKRAIHAIFHYRFCVGCHCFPCFILIIKLHCSVLSQLLCVLSFVRSSMCLFLHLQCRLVCLFCTHPPIPLLFISFQSNSHMGPILHL